MSAALQIFIAVAVVIAALATASIRNRRRVAAPPTQPRGLLPTQIDRADFPHVAAPWCVIVFSSASCQTCAQVVQKAEVLACDEVAVVNVEFTANRDLHQRYSIDAVPGVIIADKNGVVRAAFSGPVTATDLWAAVAECRNPGSSPEPELGR